MISQKKTFLLVCFVRRYTLNVEEPDASYTTTAFTMCSKFMEFYLPIVLLLTAVRN